jgi:predicted nuclease of predicted toxin-antitoxin system
VYTILTHDLDFGTLLATRKVRVPSVIQIRCRNTLPRLIGAVVLNAIQESANAIGRGALVTVSPDSYRVRFLPIEHQKL